MTMKKMPQNCFRNFNLAFLFEIFACCFTLYNLHCVCCFRIILTGNRHFPVKHFLHCWLKYMYIHTYIHVPYFELKMQFRWPKLQLATFFTRCFFPLSLSPGIFSSVRLSACPPVRLSACPPVHLSACPPVRLNG